MSRARASSIEAVTRLDLPMPAGPSIATTQPRPPTAPESACSSALSSDSRSSRPTSLVEISVHRRFGVGFGGAPDATGSPLVDYGYMPSPEPVTAVVELFLEPDGVRGVLRAQYTPDLSFSGWLGLAEAVDQ